LEDSIEECLKEGIATHGLSLALRKVIREVKLYKRHMEGKINLPEKPSPLKIQIGGGKHYIPDFLNIDILPPADIIWDVREGLPADNDCSELVFSEHLLEHLDYPVSAGRFISECFKGGRLILGVPDSELAVSAYVHKDPGYFTSTLERWRQKRDCVIDTYIDLLNYHFRDQENDEKYSPHLWSYDFDKLCFMLKEQGFVKVAKWEVDLSMANPKRVDRTIYVIATK
jgi:predicted SAM-dependent methyltransferase